MEENKSVTYNVEKVRDSLPWKDDDESENIFVKVSEEEYKEYLRQYCLLPNTKVESNDFMDWLDYYDVFKDVHDNGDGRVENFKISRFCLYGEYFIPRIAIKTLEGK